MAKILIAEDERDIRDLISLTLRFAGHDVVATSNGEEAFEKAQEIIPDLIMMDVRMPRMTGYEACRLMKEIDTLKPVPVVFLSAKGQESEVSAGLEAGAVEYILKPFAPMELTAKVAEILEKHKGKPAAASSSQPQPGQGGPISSRPPAGDPPASPPSSTPPGSDRTASDRPAGEKPASTWPPRRPSWLDRDDKDRTNK